MVKAKSCCVQGCGLTSSDVTDDTKFYHFPMNKAMKRKWLAAFKRDQKWSINSLVCSNHFTDEDYRMVRGKRMLKSTAVPRAIGEQIDSKEVVENNEPPKTAELPFIDVRTTEVIKKTPFVMDGTPMDFEETIPEAKITKTFNFVEHVSSITKSDEKVLDSVGSDRKSESDTTVHPNGDVEKLNIPEKVLENDQNVDGNEEKNSEINEGNVINKITGDRTQYVPDTIEIAVKNSRGETGSPGDCMMVLENVQVDIDPSLLMQPDEEPQDTVEIDDDDDDVRPNEPVSLLTSSDESDVIIQEPHIDTVEVSDETDEDDKPLTKLVQKPSVKKKIKNIIFGKLGEVYCYICPFVTNTQSKLNQHIITHTKSKDEITQKKIKQITTTHTKSNQEMYVCTNCVYSTPSKYQYFRHLKTHKLDKRYSCDLCSYRARHQMSLTFHMKTHEEVTRCNESDESSDMHRNLKGNRIRRKRKTRVRKSDSDEEYVPDRVRVKKSRVK